MKHITNTVKQFIAFITMTIMIFSVNAQTQDKKVVMVVSSYGQQQGEERPGYEFDEFAKAYTVFKANGIKVDVASPEGGKVIADKFDAKKPFNVPVINDTAIMSKLDNTIATSQLNATDYDGIFIVGGKGAMFDLPKDTDLQQVIATIYQQQGSVAAVCHGPAALVDVKLADGSYLIANKAINGFTNKEEKLFGQKWLKHFEFMLEDKLIERGGKFQSSDIMLSHVAVDERLITGQNPSSTSAVATELVRNLGMSPVELAPDVDDRTMAIIAQILAGKMEMVEALKSTPEHYNISLVGMYGFYYLKIAETAKQNNDALSLMLVAQKAINNPVLDMKIAQTQLKLGQKNEAKNTLKQLLEANPEHQGAMDMLKSMAL